MISTILMMIMSIITTTTVDENFYAFSFTDIDGQKHSLGEFSGKKVLIVNTASKCGFTKQYKELQELHTLYGDKLVIIGFPANNFGQQEPGTNEEIQEFCELNYGVTFLLSEKVDVLGENIDPLFAYLTQKANPDLKGDIKWNFEKFLIDEKGKLIGRYMSKVNPLDESIVSKL